MAQNGKNGQAARQFAVFFAESLAESLLEDATISRASRFSTIQRLPRARTL